MASTFPQGTTTTENGAISNLSSGSARLNLFFKAVRNLDTSSLQQFLVDSWAENPLDTLKIIFQTRDCRGGKGEKKLFAECLLWLSSHHKDTLRKNIKYIPYFGMWKDLLVLVPTPFCDDVLQLFAKQLREDLQKVQNHTNAPKNSEKKKKEVEATETTDDKAETSVVAKDKLPQPFITLAAKWAPSENHKDDKKTKSALKLALLLSENPKTALRDYRKNYLTPLRAHLKIIETFACDKRWDEIPYSLVPSRSMALHKKEFMKYDQARFEAYLKAVEEGKATIKGKQMQPHELVAQYLNGGAIDPVVELQWNVILEDVRKMGALTGSLVVSDVSGSMSGTPMEVSIALGLLLSSLAAPPFTNAVVTFHEKPSFHFVKGNTFHDRVKSLQKAPWGGSTNFQAVFDLILNKAVENKVPAEHMPTKLFVISDMQFNSADSNYESNFQRVKARYAQSGYAMPQLVFWNVRGSTSDFPVTKDEIGVAMVSGFSPSILKTLLKMGEFASPFEVLRAVLDNPRYDVLEV